MVMLHALLSTSICDLVANKQRHWEDLTPWVEWGMGLSPERKEGFSISLGIGRSFENSLRVSILPKPRHESQCTREATSMRNPPFAEGSLTPQSINTV